VVFIASAVLAFNFLAMACATRLTRTRSSERAGNQGLRTHFFTRRRGGARCRASREHQPGETLGWWASRDAAECHRAFFTACCHPTSRIVSGSSSSRRGNAEVVDSPRSIRAAPLRSIRGMNRDDFSGTDDALSPVHTAAVQIAEAVQLQGGA